MNIQIVIPAHNEAAYLSKTLDSLVTQTLLATKIVVVNDNSTDDTQEIIDRFSEKHHTIISAKTNANATHEPGSKVINAFYEGFKSIDKDYDIVCKFDADLIFPSNYLEQLAALFQQNPKVGMAGGFCYIKKKEDWVLENLTNKDHIRGALKAYRKDCFEQMNGLKKAMGWDTIDELLAQYHGWTITTDDGLHVKHLKPTGATYTKAARYKQGEAFYKMRYGWALTQIAAIKLAQRKDSIAFYYNCMRGYMKAQREKTTFLVSKEEGDFIRKLRWKKIKKKVF